MKKKISLLLSVIMVITIITGLNMTTFAASVTSGSCGADGDNVIWSYESGTLTISGSGDMEDYEVYNTSPWYTSYHANITTIIIEDGVTNIGLNAFKYCSNATEAIIADSVTDIGSYAFSNCTSLTDVTIPGTVTDIGSYAFYSCKSLTSITVPELVTTLEEYVFSHCTALTEVTILGPVTSFADRAFDQCSNLTSITIPDTVTSLGDYVFYCCKSLTEITIPDSVISIGNSTFSNCSSLVDVTIGNSVETIGTYAFYACSHLTEVTVPDSVVSLGDDVFSMCSALTSAEIGSSVESIGYCAFYKCTSLTDIVIPDSVTLIDDYAFYVCTSLENVEIGDSVESIGYASFYQCSSLTDVTIPDSVTDLGEWAFAGCTELTDASLGDSVESIGDYAFYACTSLAEIFIPDSVESIGEAAFDYCNITVYANCYKDNFDVAEYCESQSDDETILIYADVHSIIYEEGEEESCTEDGSKEYWYCDNCGKYFSDADAATELTEEEIKDLVIPATGHDLTHVYPKDATCTEEGYKEYWYCPICEKYFSNAEATEETSLEDVIIPKTEHTFGEEGTYVEGSYTAPTENTEGSYQMEYICTVCGYTEIRDFTIPVLEHNYQLDTERSYDATCTADGQNVYVCQNCGDEYIEIIPATNHTNAEFTPAVEKEYCTDEGMEAYWYCPDCDTYFTNIVVDEENTIGEETTLDELIIAATEHTFSEEGTYVEGSYIAPTEKDEGSYQMEYTCTICGYTETRDFTIPVLEHNYQLDTERSYDATCTADGQNVYVCQNCGDEHIEVILATGHNYIGLLTAYQAAAEDEDGYYTITYTCAKCGDEGTYTGTLPAGSDNTVAVEEYNQEDETVIVNLGSDEEGNDINVSISVSDAIKDENEDGTITFTTKDGLIFVLGSQSDIPSEEESTTEEPSEEEPSTEEPTAEEPINTDTEVPIVEEVEEPEEDTIEYVEVTGEDTEEPEEEDAEEETAEEAEEAEEDTEEAAEVEEETTEKTAEVSSESSTSPATGITIFGGVLFVLLIALAAVLILKRKNKAEDEA